jgi:hypothetical protein
MYIWVVNSRRKKSPELSDGTLLDFIQQHKDKFEPVSIFRVRSIYCTSQHETYILWFINLSINFTKKFQQQNNIPPCFMCDGKLDQLLWYEYLMCPKGVTAVRD